MPCSPPPLSMKGRQWIEGEERKNKQDNMKPHLSHFFYSSALFLSFFLILFFFFDDDLFFSFSFFCLSSFPVFPPSHPLIFFFFHSFFPISSVSFCEHLTAPIPLLSTFPFLSSSVYLPFLSFFYGYEYMCILLFPSQFFSPYTFIYRIYVYLYLQYTFLIDLRRTVHKAAHTPLSSVYID